MKRSKKKKSKKLRVLAIDPATKCGFAISREIYGVWDLRVKKDESDSMRLIRFKSKFVEVIGLEKINLVVFERPAGRNVRGIITQSEIQGVIKTVCTEQNIDFRAYSSKEIKVKATGKGNSGKPAMIAAAAEKLGYVGNDDNEADALWLLELAKDEYLT